MAHFIDIACSYLDFMTLTLIIITLVLGMIITLIFVKYGDFWKVESYFKLSVLTAFVVVFFLLFDTICIYPNAKAALTRTNDSDILSIECLVPRKAEVDFLRNQLLKMDNVGYLLLEGLHGSGKSTLLKMSIPSFNESGRAHLYVTIKFYGDVAQGLYSALRIQEYCDSTWAKMRSYLGIQASVCPKKEEERLLYALNLLIELCSEVHDATGIPPLIIFDNTAWILKTPGGLDTIFHLQDMAKAAVDEGGYMTVLFLSSESSVPNILRSRSSKSRMRSTLYVGDISDKEAIEYITCLCKNASNEVLTRAVHYFGGRFIHLRLAATDIDEGGGAGLQRRIELMYAELSVSTGLLPPTVMDILENVVKNITQSPTKTITHINYIHNTGLSKDDRDLIDKTNILNINHREHSVSFASRIVERFFEEHYWHNKYNRV